MADPAPVEAQAPSPIYDESWAPTTDNRYFVMKAHGPVHLGKASAAGYYTVIMFSAETCEPCHQLRREVPAWLQQFPNVVVVEIDVGGPDGTASGPEVEIMRDLKVPRLPVAVLMGPFGQTIRVVSGADDVRWLFAALDKRKRRDVLPFTLLPRPVPTRSVQDPTHSSDM